MSDLVSRQQTALQPLRQALVARAGAEADRLRASAETEGEHAVAAAHDEVDALLSSARAQGEADGAAALAAERATARRSARATLLAAQRAAYEELRSGAVQAVHQLLREPANRSLLTAAVQRGLGEFASVSDTDDGGLFAQAPDGRSIDASISVLVDSALADLDLEPLWTPT